MTDDRPVLGVTGSPVLHSMSPAIFREIFASEGRQAAYLRVAARSAAAAVALARGAGLGGLNVTSPFKDEAASLADELERCAHDLKSANVLVFRPDGTVLGANTDADGVTGSLGARGISVAGKSCLVIGLGGAGRSAAWALARSGGIVTIANRTVDKARALADTLMGSIGVGVFAAGLGDLARLVGSCDIVVSALSSASLPDPHAWLKAGTAVVDADYRVGRLATVAAAMGCTVVTGLEWLIYQALPARDYFLGPRSASGPLAEPLAERIGKALATSPRASQKASRAIVLVGLPASGKTSVGKALAARSGRSFVDADDAIEAEAGMTIPAIFAAEGESGFRAREERSLERLVSRGGGVVIAAGGGVATRAANRELIARECLGVWLYASPECAALRSRGGSRPLLAGQDPVTRIAELQAERRFGYASCAELLVSAQDEDPPTIAELIHDEITRSL
ncbi:MAG: shikimate kinase [Spirochaetaceae bacterium]|nr:shikimate kinase [Spirochaetaceae bacterium]